MLGEANKHLIPLLAGTAQRRRTVVGAKFSNIKQFGDEALWSIPPYFRKTANKRRSRLPHRIPLLGFAAEAERALDDLIENDCAWLFPIGKTETGVDPKVPHSDPGRVNKQLAAMPRTDISPHGVRRAFASYGQRDLGISLIEAKLILDHMEGVDVGDVTAEFYALDPQIQRKREMMRAWIGWLEKWAAIALEADPRLQDFDLIRQDVYIHRYGEDARDEKLSRARRLGIDPFAQIYAGKKARQIEAEAARRAAGLY